LRKATKALRGKKSSELGEFAESLRTDWCNAESGMVAVRGEEDAFNPPQPHCFSACPATESVWLLS